MQDKNYKKAIFHASRVIDAWLPIKILYDRTPGCAVGIVYKGKLVYKKGFGYANLEQQKKINSKTCFRIASISKTFTSVAIMQLVEKGKLNLDDKIVKYLSWFRVKNKDNDASKISIRQVLSHTAGVFRDGITAHWENDKFPDLQALKKSLSKKSLVYENLTQFKYSNFGYAILGQVIEQVSGLKYNQYVKKNIINKLDLKNTAPDYTLMYEDFLATGYERPIPNKERGFYLNSETKTYAAATGFISNVEDLAKYLVALSLNNKSKNTLISKESKKEMFMGYWQIDDKGETYGLGFDINNINNRKVIGHGGGYCGFITQISLDVENDIGVITLSNSNDAMIGMINRSIFEIIYEFFDNLSKYQISNNKIKLEKYEGWYRNRWEDKSIVKVEDVLVAFCSKINNPLDDFMILKPKKKDVFVFKTDSVFDCRGEIVKFNFKSRQKNACNVFWGPSPSVRIK